MAVEKPKAEVRISAGKVVVNGRVYDPDYILSLSKEEIIERFNVDFVTATEIREVAARDAVKKQPLRRTIEFKTGPTHLWTKVKQIIVDGELRSVEPVFKVFEARDNHGQLHIIYDVDGYINRHRKDYALVVLDKESIRELLQEAPQFVLNRIKRALELYGVKPPSEKGKSTEERMKAIGELVNLLYEYGVIKTPVPVLRDASFLKGFDWREFVDRALTFNADIDSRLKLIRAAHALRGIEMTYNPHAIIVTQGGTGKSTFYQVWGILKDKVTANSLVGYARGRDEIYRGSLDGLILSLGIDQIEQQHRQFLDYLFNYMEYGKTNVDTGGVPFTIQGAATLAFLGNPVFDSSEKSMRYILELMSFNKTFGRRIGIIFFDPDAKVLKERMSTQDFRRWYEDHVRIIRAVEDYVWKELKRIWHDSRVESWLKKEIEGYEAAVLERAQQAKEEFLRKFLEEHVKAQHRIRGAALRIALLYNLDKIALGEYSIEEILAEAEEYVGVLASMNLASISRMIEEVETKREDAIVESFNTLPKYAKIIVAFLERYKRRKIAELQEKGLGQVPDKVKNEVIVLDRLAKDISFLVAGESYTYLSKALNKVKNLKGRRGARILETLRRDFGIHIMVKEYGAAKRVEARILDWRPLPDEIFHHFTVFTVSPFLGKEDVSPQGDKVTEVTASQVKEVKETSETKPLPENGEMVKTVKRGKTGKTLEDRTSENDSISPFSFGSLQKESTEVTEVSEVSEYAQNNTIKSSTEEPQKWDLPHLYITIYEKLKEKSEDGLTLEEVRRLYNPPQELLEKVLLFGERVGKLERRGDRIVLKG